MNEKFLDDVTYFLLAINHAYDYYMYISLTKDRNVNALNDHAW